jgi:hypothetical protein
VVDARRRDPAIPGPDQPPGLGAVPHGDALVNDGDIVILEQTSACDDGDMVAAWLRIPSEEWFAIRSDLEALRGGD